MPCDAIRSKPYQTLEQRMEEIREKTAIIGGLIVQNKVKAVVGPQGAVTFTGIPDDVRAGMTDGCIFRRITSPTGNALAAAKIAQAGPVNKQVIAQGIHSHDGGSTWHPRG